MLRKSNQKDIGYSYPLFWPFIFVKIYLPLFFKRSSKVERKIASKPHYFNLTIKILPSPPSVFGRHILHRHNSNIQSIEQSVVSLQRYGILYIICQNFKKGGFGSRK